MCSESTGKHQINLFVNLGPQQQHQAHLEEKLRLLAQARDEVQSTCLQQKQTVADAQARASQLGMQVESLRQVINAGEGMEKREPSYTVSGNAN